MLVFIVTSLTVACYGDSLANVKMFVYIN
jgi:hypothetical protein